jgi:putative two-component system response regulator
VNLAIGAFPGRRPRVLCVDDEAVTLRLVTRLMERLGFDVAGYPDATAALDAWDDGDFDLVITDIRMPGMDGVSFMRALRERDVHVPVVVATGHATLDTAVRALREGASGMIVKPFTAEELVAEIRTALEHARIRRDAIQYRFVTPVLDGVALALTAAIEARDLETGEHCRQLGVLGERVAALLGMSEQDRTHIRIGGYLHDVGKIAIADRILLKPGPLTDDEYREMQRHSELGEGIVRTHEAMGEIATIVRHHHERWDGAGYPDRLAGTDIPIGARIIAVADAFSAMTSDRVYRWSLGVEAAWAELRRHAGKQFDPQVVELFEAAVDPDQRPPEPVDVREDASSG